MIIQSKNSKKQQVFEIVATAIGWAFLILFLFVLGSNIKWKFSGDVYLLALVNANAIILFTVVISIISFLGLYFWGIYNKLRYGNLHRRTFPKPTKIEGIADYYVLSSQKVLELQQEKYVER
jgi:poly-beta-1,6-N-acetyl-D-glucosamine biosynthesis protein PgaD